MKIVTYEKPRIHWYLQITSNSLEITYGFLLLKGHVYFRMFEIFSVKLKFQNSTIEKIIESSKEILVMYCFRVNGFSFRGNKKQTRY